jgi:hypothetical protein
MHAAQDGQGGMTVGLDGIFLATGIEGSWQ